MIKRHVAIVGAGIVGLAVAYHLVRAGARVTVIDRDLHGDKASFGNAGAIAVTEVLPASIPGVWLKAFRWMMDPLGPLSIRPLHLPRLLPWLAHFSRSSRPSEFSRISSALAAINARVYEDLLPLLRDVGLGSDLRQYGALTLYETEQGYRRDEAEWARKRNHNIIAEEISGDEARRLEPALGRIVRRGVWTPQWSYVSDPKAVAMALVRWLQERQVLFRKGEVSHIARSSASAIHVTLNGDRDLPAEQVVIAAGAWSAPLARQLGDPVLLESERGYNVTIPHPGINVRRQLIFAERKFVATPLDCGLRIGGAAEFGGLRAAANFERCRRLLTLAKRYLPDLNGDEEKHWSGHRPATPDSLPVIGRARRDQSVFYAFGHGHLGLTQAATTGRIISELSLGKAPCIDVSPYSADRFD